MQKTTTSKQVMLKKILDSAKLLTTEEKIKLIQIISSQIETELKHQKMKPKKPLRGLWEGIDIKENDIEELRKEMGQQFPRKDI